MEYIYTHTLTHIHVDKEERECMCLMCVIILIVLFPSNLYIYDIYLLRKLLRKWKTAEEKMTNETASFINLFSNSHWAAWCDWPRHMYLWEYSLLYKSPCVRPSRDFNYVLLWSVERPIAFSFRGRLSFYFHNCIVVFFFILTY